MSTQPRTFEINEATRSETPLPIGLVGPSGGGKTVSALELAHGMQEVFGGDIGYIDTEAKRALHYAKAPMFSDKSRIYQFKHMPFGSPFNPESYKQAIAAFIAKGAKTIIVDSMSHEHEGPGGVLEMHEKKLDKLAGEDWAKRERSTFLAWAEPKQERRALINFMLQQNVNFILCFRAKEKLKMVKVDGKNTPVQQGWQPIAGEEYVFEMMVNCLLPPGAGGVPSWNPAEPAEKVMVKLPGHFRDLLTSGKPLSAKIGREMAIWAKGGTVQPTPVPEKAPEPPQKEAPTPQEAPYSAQHTVLALNSLLQQASTLEALNLAAKEVEKAKTAGKLDAGQIAGLGGTYLEVKAFLLGKK